jgi:O-antigen/teichoic acid export membrane protein
MPSFIVKEVAPMFEERNGDEIQGVILFALRTAALYMCFLALCLIVAWYLRIGWDYREFGVLMWFHVALQILNACRAALLRAVGRIVKGQLIDRLIQPTLTMSLTAAGWAAFGSSFKPSEAVLALLLSNALCLSLGAYWVRQELGDLLSEATPTKAGADHLKALLNLSGVGLLNSIFTNGVTLVVGWVGSVESAALYRLAASVAVILNYFQEVMIQVVAPRVAQLWYSGDRRALTRILMVGAVLNSTTIALGTATFAFFGHAILRVAYGAQYQQAYLPLVILCCSNLAYALGGYRDLLLNMSGHAKEAFRISLVLVPVSLVVATIGTMELAETGAALAVLIFQLAASIWLTISTRRFTNIDPSILGLIRNRQDHESHRPSPATHTVP